MLAFSRRQKLLIEPIDIAAMFDDISALIRQSLGDQHQIEILQDDPTLCAFGDINQLELALLNLTINARDASPAGSAIRIAITGEGSAKDGQVIIAVRDDGEGMDEATRLRAFEPFFTTKSHGSGTGLGLAQVFGAGRAVGRDGVDRQRTRRRHDGAPFAPPLPHRRAPHQPVRAPRRRPQGSDAPLRLLVVDDDPLVRAAIVRPLEDAGHIVDAVSDGPTALAAIGERGFDLVVVDFAMPGMDGAEVIRRAAAIRPEARFLIVSGYADSQAIAAASPDTPLLKKPFDNDVLVKRVGDLAR